MITINIIKEINKRTKNLKLPLHSFLNVVAINHSTFQKWIDGYLNPSRKNIQKLRELLLVIEKLEQIKEKTSFQNTQTPKQLPLSKRTTLNSSEKIFVKPGFLSKNKDVFIIDDRSYKIHQCLLDL